MLHANSFSTLKRIHHRVTQVKQWTKMCRNYRIIDSVYEKFTINDNLMKAVSNGVQTHLRDYF